jgi:hypothetical protein
VSLICGDNCVSGGGKNGKALAAIQKMIERVGPGVIALPHASEKGSRRAQRIQKLVRDIMIVAKKRGIAVKLTTQKELRDHFFAGQNGTKFGRAKILAQRFPQELAHLLPPKREAWMNENPKMAMFDAVAFASILSAGGQTRPVLGS